MNDELKPLIELQETFKQNSGKQFRQNSVNVKLPKLIISKFEGKNLDLLRYGVKLKQK